ARPFAAPDRPLRLRQRRPQPLRDLPHFPGSVRPFAPRQPRDAAWAGDAHAVELRLGEQRQTVALDEAHGAHHTNAVAEQLGDDRYLPADTLDQLCLVAPADDQSLARLREQTALMAHPHLASTSLGVDHRHTAGADRQMVDVRARAWY